MKKYMLLLISFSMMMKIYAHDQQGEFVHQRIVYEAYKLLKIQLSKEANGIADIDQYVGELNHHKVYYW